MLLKYFHDFNKIYVFLNNFVNKQQIMMKTLLKYVQSILKGKSII